MSGRVQLLWSHVFQQQERKLVTRLFVVEQAFECPDAHAAFALVEERYLDVAFTYAMRYKFHSILRPRSRSCVAACPYNQCQHRGGLGCILPVLGRC